MSNDPKPISTAFRFPAPLLERLREVVDARKKRVPGYSMNSLVIEALETWLETNAKV